MIHLNRRQLLTGAAALTGAGLLAGCSPSMTPSGAETLQFWHLLSGGDGVTMSGLLDKVNAAQDAYHVRPTVLAWGTPYYTKLAIAGAGGRAPDVAIMHATRVAGYAPGGLLDTWDLDRLASLGVDESTFAAPIWDKGKIGDKRFSVALDAHPFVLMFNTDICDKAGVLDSDGNLPPISSPDEFVEVMQAITGASESHGLSYGYLGDGSQMWRLFYTLYTQHGAEMEFPQEGAPVIDDDAAVASLTFMRSLLDGKIAAPQADYQTAIAEFATGKSGVLLTGVWELRTVQAAGFPFNAAVIPTMFGTPASYADSHTFVLPHQAQPDEHRRELTYQFVADLLKNSFDWATAGHIPAYLPVTESSEYADLLPQANYAVAADQVRYDPPAWFTGSGSEFHSEFGATAQPVLLSGDDPGAAVKKFRDYVTRQLSKPNPADPKGVWKP